MTLRAISQPALPDCPKTRNPDEICGLVQMQKLFYSSILLLAGTGTIFYYLQNSSALPGGNIALPKLFWLSIAILCWYIIPAFLVSDHRLSNLRWPLGIFLGNMVARGIAELFMMYGLNNWHPYYGIAHDMLSSLLCVILAFFSAARSKLIAGYFSAMAILFIIEAGFASYMLMYIKPVDGPVYYVPSGEEHAAIMGVTTVVIIATTAYLFIFIKKWLYEKSFEG